jgi:hypothetical protein
MLFSDETTRTIARIQQDIERAMASKVESLPPEKKFTVQWEFNGSIGAKVVMARSQEQAEEICRNLCNEDYLSQRITKAREYDAVTDWMLDDAR